MNNPYTLLQIKQTANENEIREALKRQINLYCGREGNRKNNDNEYLHQIFRNAAKDLLDPEKRRKIDEEIAKENELHGVVPYNSSENKNQEEYENHLVTKGDNNQLEEIDEKELAVKRSQYTITSLNEALLNSSFLNFIDILPPTCYNYSDSIFETHNLYGVIGEDNSFMFACEGYISDVILGRTYFLISTFSRQQLYKNKRESPRPWMNDEIFQVNGVNSIAIPGAKIIPEELIESSKKHPAYISSSNLKKISSILKRHLVNNPNFTKQIFDKDTFTKKKV